MFEYNIEDDFDLDIHLNESALDDMDDSDVYDNNFSEITSDYSKCDFILTIRLHYLPYNRCYKGNIKETALKIIKRVMSRIYMLIEDSVFNDTPEDVFKIYLTNRNKINADITDTEGVFNILNNDGICHLTVEGKTCLYTELHKDYIRNTLEKLYYKIAAYIHKTGIKDLVYNRTKLNFLGLKTKLERCLNVSENNILGIVPEPNFNNIDWNFGTVFHGINIESGESFEYKDNVYAELDESGNDISVDDDFFFNGHTNKLIVCMNLCQMTNNCVQLYNSINSKQITIYKGMKTKYSPYGESDSRIINRTFKYLQTNLMQFIKEHQDEIKYRTCLKLVNSYEEYNVLIASFMTNVRVIIGDMTFFVSGHIRTNLDISQSDKLTKEQKDKIKNFIEAVNLRYSNRKELDKLINDTFGVKMK